jgi:hypothetical protein
LAIHQDDLASTDFVSNVQSGAVAGPHYEYHHHFGKAKPKRNHSANKLSRLQCIEGLLAFGLPNSGSSCIQIQAVNFFADIGGGPC